MKPSSVTHACLLTHVTLHQDTHTHTHTHSDRVHRYTNKTKIQSKNFATVWIELSHLMFHSWNECVVCVSSCKRVLRNFCRRRSFYVCVFVCVCLCCTAPANSNSSVASEQEERGSLKTQIQQLHNQQFCSSQNPPVLRTHSSLVPIFLSLPRMLAQPTHHPPLLP